MTSPREIAAVMGGTAVIGRDVRTLRDLAEVVESGLPKSALRTTAKHIFDSPRDVNRLIYGVVPEATYKRRTKLSPAEGERTQRLARVIAMAEYVWNNPEKARRWLTLDHPLLGGKTPLQCAVAEVGAQQVEDLLGGLFYGLPL